MTEQKPTESIPKAALIVLALGILFVLLTIYYLSSTKPKVPALTVEASTPGLKDELKPTTPKDDQTQAPLVQNFPLYKFDGFPWLNGVDIARALGETVVLESASSSVHPFKKALCTDGLVHSVKFQRTVKASDPNSNLDGPMVDRVGDHYQLMAPKDSSPNLCLLFVDEDVTAPSVDYSVSIVSDFCSGAKSQDPSCQKSSNHECSEADKGALLSVGETSGRLRTCELYAMDGETHVVFGLIKTETNCHMNFGIRAKSQWIPGTSLGEMMFGSECTVGLDDEDFSEPYIMAFNLLTLFHWNQKAYVMIRVRSQSSYVLSVLEWNDAGLQEMIRAEEAINFF